ncbi:MAG TPA: hypothetical protein VKP65_14205 [Rhodothermales bacterium]|nr:hypothetical protein [Rhodothermales bacterium]
MLKMIKSMNRFYYAFLLAFFFLTTAPLAHAQTTVYVDATATGTDDGTSWQNAFPNLQDALNAAISGDEIWIAQGTYTPDHGTGDRTATFRVPSGVRLYGGFAGSETQRQDRDLAIHPTRLSGDLNGDDAPDFANNSDNSYHVVTLTDADAATVLDGLIITAGNADGAGDNGSGGGLWNDGGDPMLTRMMFLGNTATQGGALFNQSGNPSISNAVFSGNAASSQGGAIYSEDGDPMLLNITVSGNTAPEGAALYNQNSSPTLTNSIVWGNTAPGSGGTAQLNCEQEGYPCRLSQVDSAILERSDQLGDEVLRMLNNGQTLADALAWIQTEDGVVEADADDASLRFRLEGGRPTWVFSDNAFDFEANRPAPLPLERRAHTEWQQPDDLQDVVGDNPKTKRALVLAPYLYEFGGSDSGPAVANLLNTARGYEGNVTYVANPSETTSSNVSVDQFTNWGNYDVVFISTHGTQQCKEGECRTALLTSVHINVQDIPLNDPPGLILAKVVEGRRTIGLTNDFFANQYPQGLSDAILYIDACQTFKSPELATALTGEAGTYFGWSETVGASFSKSAATTFFGDLIEKGIPTGKALGTLQSQNMTTYGETGATLTTNVMGDELRIREIVYLQHPLSEEDLPVDLPYPVVGEPEDGEPDKIPYLVKVDGIDGEPSGFTVNVMVNGFSGDAKSVAEGKMLDDNTWQVKGTVQVPFDAEQGQEVDIEVRVDLPEGGESRWEETVTLGNPVLHFTSEIESVSAEGRIFGKVEAEVELAFDEDLEQIEGEDDLEYLEYTVEVPNAGCDVTTTTTDGTLRIPEVVFTSSDEGIGSVEEIVLFPVNNISETVIITCPEGTNTIDTIHWFAGFVSFHGQLGGTNEFDENRGGFVMPGWTAGSGDVIARKVYDRSHTEDEVTLTEKTTIEIRKPD